MFDNFFAKLEKSSNFQLRRYESILLTEKMTEKHQFCVIKECEITQLILFSLPHTFVMRGKTIVFHRKIRNP